MAEQAEGVKIKTAKPVRFIIGILTNQQLYQHTPALALL